MFQFAQHLKSFNIIAVFFWFFFLCVAFRFVSLGNTTLSFFFFKEKLKKNKKLAEISGKKLEKMVIDAISIKPNSKLNPR